MSTDGRLTTIDGREALVFERHLAHPADRVWRAISEPDELAQWFVTPVDLRGTTAGDTFEKLGKTGEVVEHQPGSVIAWEWDGEGIRFEVRSAQGDEGCVLTFTHLFATPEDSAHYATGWHLHLDRLEALLGGGHIASHDELMEHFDPHHDRYTAAFGMDPEASRRRMAVRAAEFT